MKLKQLAKMKTSGERLIIASATGKFKGEIYFLSEDTDLDNVDEWFLCVPAKELKAFLTNL